MTSALASPPSNFQLQSPLFGVLPAEIRNEIFELALMQYEDDASAYPKDSYWYRPGFSGPHKGSSALLRTCRLAYAEGQKVFLRELEWAFWFGTRSLLSNSLAILTLTFQTVAQKVARATAHAKTSLEI